MGGLGIIINVLRNGPSYGMLNIYLLKSTTCQLIVIKFIVPGGSLHHSCSFFRYIEIFESTMMEANTTIQRQMEINRKFPNSNLDDVFRKPCFQSRTDVRSRKS